MSDPDNTSQVLYEVQDSFATITMNRPDALNAITPQMLEQLGAAFAEARDDDEVKVVVLTGAGRAFSSGVDLKALGDVKIVDGMVGDILDIPARGAIEIMRVTPKPIVAKVNGFCFTGALELALACDLMIVAEEAKFGDTHSKWGLRPTWGMSARLPAAVGLQRARELSMTARTFRGREAFDMGMAVRCVPLAELDEATIAFCKELAENSGQSIEAYKTLYESPEVSAALQREFEAIFKITGSNERLAAFM